MATAGGGSLMPPISSSPGPPPPKPKKSPTSPRHHQLPRAVAPNGDIVVLGLAKSNDEKAKKTLDQLPAILIDKGFEVLLFTPSQDDDGATHMLVLRVEARLLVRIALKMGLPVRSEADYSIYHRTTIATLLMALVRKTLSPHFTYREMGLLHEPASLERVVTSSDPSLLMQYCGSEIALYHAWLQWYTRLLVAPAMAGAFLLAFELAASRRGHEPSTSIFVPVFNVLLCLWTTLLLEGWKRQNATLAFSWGILNKPDLLSRPEESGSASGGKASGGSSKEDSALFLYGVSLPAHVVIIVALIRMMLYFVWLSDNAAHVYGPSSWLQYLPTLLYSVVPPTAQALYGYVVVFLNDREGHTSREESRAAMQLKLFAFQFVNCFSSLFYIAFWLQDLTRLQSMLASLLVTKQIIGNVVEMAMPTVKAWMADVRNERDLQAKVGTSSSSLNGGKPGRVERVAKAIFHRAYGWWEGSQSSEKAKAKAAKVEAAKQAAAAYAIENPQLEEAVLTETECEAYDVAAEHTEILIQFGYVTMFAVVFPLAPLLALLNNIWEARLDILKLKVMRRPTPVLARNLGGWATALEVMSFAAVLTNCLLMARTSKESLQQLTPSALHFLLDSPHGRLLMALALEHLMLVFKYALAALIDDVPLAIREQLKREEVAAREDMFKSRRNLGQSTQALGSTRAAAGAWGGVVAGASTMLGGAAGGGGGGGMAAAAVPLDPYQKIAAEFKAGQLPAFSPLMFLPLMAMPYAVMWLRLSAWWLLPASFLYLSYLHNIKTRRETRSAMQVATDPDVVRAVMHHLPPWFFDADLERTQWLSMVLAKLWNSVSGMTEKLVIESVQPILNESRPAFFNRLTLTKCNLGTIAPVVTGVRFVNTTEEVVRLDIHISWSGNPDIVLEVGYKGMPLVLELSEIQFKGKVRVELNPLVPQIPGFGAILCTFMEDPFCNFSFKIGNLDVMAMGAPDMSIADVVANIIRENVLRGFMLYPHSLVIPMLTEVDAEKLRNPPPMGLLTLSILGAKNLIIGDIRSSDPYVKVVYGADQKHKTTVKRATLNPVWNEDFVLRVYDRSQHVYLYVRDHDLIGKHDSLGTYKLRIDTLPPLKPLDLDLELNEVKSGTLQVRLLYTPCHREGDEDEEDDDDASLDSAAMDGFPGAGRFSVDSRVLGDDDDDLDSSSRADDEQRSRRDSSNANPPGLNGAALQRGNSSSMRRTVGSSVSDGPPPVVGVLQVDGLQVKGYTGKQGLMGSTKVCLQIALGNTAHRTTWEKAPCHNPTFGDRFTFQVTSTMASHGQLSIAILEKSGGLGAHSKVLGSRSLDLAGLCKRPATRIDQDWPIEGKGRVFQLHMLTNFAELQGSNR